MIGTAILKGMAVTLRNFAGSYFEKGKSYPVTAAQLLPSLTGFLAPIHFSKLAKDWHED